MQTEPWAILLVIFSVLIGSFGPILLKTGAHRLSRNPWSFIRNRHLIGGLFCYGVGTIMYIIALRGGELSVLYPIISISYPIVAFLSVIFLKEKMNKMKIMGTVFVILGIILVSVS
jgi:uncharacterized membrane protein